VCVISIFKNNKNFFITFLLTCLHIYTQTVVFCLLYRLTCVSQNLPPGLRTGRFCWSRVLVPACPLLMATSTFGLGRSGHTYTSVSCYSCLHIGRSTKLLWILPWSCLCCLYSLSEDDVDTDKELLTTNKRREENRRTRDKMKLVRSQMERCTLLKEKRDQVDHLLTVEISYFSRSVSDAAFD